jgi:hypothetical protein
LQKTGDAPNSGDFFGSSGKEGKKKKERITSSPSPSLPTEKASQGKGKGPAKSLSLFLFFPRRIIPPWEQHSISKRERSKGEKKKRTRQFLEFPPALPQRKYIEPIEKKIFRGKKSLSLYICLHMRTHPSPPFPSTWKERKPPLSPQDL